jgi:single-stranded DNA-binding protein
MNTCIFILTLTEDPIQEFYKTQIKLLEVSANFNYLLKEKVFNETFNLLIWGDQANDVLKHYKKDDYIVVEGFLRISSEFYQNNLKIKEKKIEITVIDIYLLFPVV